MSEEYAVQIKDIHKDFVLPQSRQTSVKQLAVNIVRKNNRTTQQVLDGVSFNINKGDFFGIVGRNGSGKSTLLKLIAGVYTPTSGKIEIHGGLTPFIELGVGFNPELSGRDNVYLNGALLGYTRKQMDVMYDEIVDFADLGPFMDQKLKNYSSGMQVRLAFSIAVKAKNDVLIFDEVLAVGDEAFQQKCIDTFEKYKAQKQTIILVTHDMDTVKRFCNKAVMLQNGKVVHEGSPRLVADKYSKANQKPTATKVNREPGALNGLNVEIKQDGKPTNLIHSGVPFSISIHYLALPGVKSFVVSIYRQSGEHLTSFRVESKRSCNGFDINLTRPYIGKGKYFLYIETRKSDDTPAFEPIECAAFAVASVPATPIWSGMVYIDNTITYSHE